MVSANLVYGGRCPGYSTAFRDLAKAGLIAPNWQGKRPRKANISTVWGEVIDAAVERDDRLEASISPSKIGELWEMDWRTVRRVFEYLEACGRIVQLARGLYQVIPVHPLPPKEPTSPPLEDYAFSQSDSGKMQVDSGKMSVPEKQQTQAKCRVDSGKMQVSTDILPESILIRHQDSKDAAGGEAADGDWEDLLDEDPDPSDELLDHFADINTKRHIFKRGFPPPASHALTVLDIYFHAAARAQSLRCEIEKDNPPRDRHLLENNLVNEVYPRDPSRAQRDLKKAHKRACAIRRQRKKRVAEQTKAQKRQDKRVRAAGAMPTPDPELDDPNLNPVAWVRVRCPELWARVRALLPNPEFKRRFQAERVQPFTNWRTRRQSPSLLRDLRSQFLGTLSRLCNSFEVYS